ncbi:MAG: PAS domain S-box protein [Anaerolineae bacterium]|nr:PAS domain S-box protein [Anaerolineae bacterium]
MNEQGKQGYHEALLQSLNAYVLALGSARFSEDLFALAARQLQKTLDAVAVVIFAYEEQTDNLIALHTTLQEGEDLRLARILGRGIKGQSWKLPLASRQRLIRERVVLEPGVTGISFGEIPSPIGALIERAFGVGWFAALVLQQDEDFVGVAVIAWKLGVQPPAAVALQAFATVTGSAIRRWRAESSLRESEQRWQFALEGAGDGVWDWNIQTDEVFFSRQWKAMLGYSEHEIGTSLGEWSGRVYSEDQLDCQTDLTRHFNGETPVYQNEHRLRCKDGSYKWVLDRGKIVEWTPDGRPLRMIGTHTDITARKQAEANLRQLKEFNESVIINMTEGVVMTDALGTVIFVNPAMVTMLGCTVKELLGQSWMVFVPPESHPVVRAADVRRAAGQSDRYEVDLRRKDGRLLSTLVSGGPYFDPKTDTFAGTVAVFTDITERKRAEEALRLQSLVLDQIHDHVTITDLDGRITYVNDIESRALKQPREALIGRSVKDYGEDPVRGATQREIINQTLQTSYWRGEVVNYAADGSEVIFDARTQLIHDADGAPLVMCGIATDITERKRVEMELRRRTVVLAGLNETALALAEQQDLETLLRIIVERSLLMLDARAGSIYLYRSTTDDLKRHFVCGREDPQVGDVIQRGEGLVGKVLDSCHSLIVDDYMSWNGRSPQYRVMECLAGIGSPIIWRTHVLGVLLLRDEAPRRFSEADRTLLESLASLAAAALENTHLLETERAQRHLAETLREVAAVLSSSLNRERVLTLILEQLARVVAYDSASVMLTGESTLNIVAARGFQSRSQWDVGLRAEALEHIQTVLEERHPVIILETETDARWQRLPGSEYIRSWLGVPLVVQDRVIGLINLDSSQPHYYTPAHGDLTAAFANQAAIAIENARLYEDIRQRMDDLHRAQAQLVQSAKMAAIGRLSAGIAHELNNPLTAILLSAKALLRRLPEASEEQRELAAIVDEARRTTDIVRGLLDFSRQTELHRQWLDVNQVLQESLALVRRLIAQRGIVIQELYAPDLPQLYLDANRMKQVFLNLITNAADAMPKSGQLTLLSERVGAEVAVRIRDTGAGILPEHLHRLFEPFFTTKPVGEGTGLGLSVSLGIVQDHGGRIGVESQVGEGSCFSVILPVAVTEKQRLLGEEILG